MKHISRFFCTIFLLFVVISAIAQETENKVFDAYIYNKEYKVFLKINAYDKNIVVPGQEVFGEMVGYLKGQTNSYCWLITDMEINKDGKSAKLFFTNDWGSEDFIATLTLGKDGAYTLKYIEGSTFKIPINSKWVKLPKEMKFEKK